MSKRLCKFAAVLVAVMMLASIFAGCGSAKVQPEETQQAEQPAAAEQPAQEDKAKEELKEVTLKFYFPSEKRSATDEVWNTIGEKFKDQLNAKFEVNFIPFNDYTDKLTVMSASGDKYDMNFDGNWLSYPRMVNKGAYLALNDLLPKYAPNTYAALQKAGSLQAASVKGNIMCVPWEMKMNQQRQFPHWRQDVAQKAGLNYANESIKTIEDLDKFLHEAKKVVPAELKLFGWDNDDLGSISRTLLARDEMDVLEFHNFAVSINDDKCTIVPIEQTPAFKEAAKYAKNWTDDGILPKNLMVDKVQISAAYRNGEVFASNGSHEWAFADAGFADKSWIQGYSELYADKKSPNRSALANITCINKNAANPERALMFMDLLSTSQELYDLALYGIKDKTYVLNGETADFPAGITAANSSYLDWQGQWAWWKPQFMRPTQTYPKGFWQKEGEFASTPVSVASKLDGLFFDTDSIKNEIAKRDQLNTEQGKLIQYGLVKDSDAAVDEYIQKQKDAGLDKIVAELQKQIDAFLASK